MRVGVQFTGTLPAGGSNRWFTHSWPQEWHVIWHVAPVTPRAGAPQVEWDVQVERASTTHITYWITVRNLSQVQLNFEGRYAILNL
jgi:hypothetical protein